MEICKATSFDEIFNVLKLCSDSFYEQSYNEENKINELANKYYSCAETAIAYEYGSVLGFASYYLKKITDNTAFLSMLIVKGEFQGKGVGKALLDFVIDDCKCNFVEKIRLEVNTQNSRAIFLYDKKGFKRECAASNESDYFILEM